MNLIDHTLAHQCPSYSIYAATELGCDRKVYACVSGDPWVSKSPSPSDADLATPPRAHLLWGLEDSAGGLTTGSPLSGRVASRMLASEGALGGEASLGAGGGSQPANPASSGFTPSSSVRLLVPRDPPRGNDARASARETIAYETHDRCAVWTDTGRLLFQCRTRNAV